MASKNMRNLALKVLTDPIKERDFYKVLEAANVKKWPLPNGTGELIERLHKDGLILVDSVPDRHNSYHSEYVIAPLDKKEELKLFLLEDRLARLRCEGAILADDQKRLEKRREDNAKTIASFEAQINLLKMSGVSLSGKASAEPVRSVRRMKDDSEFEVLVKLQEKVLSQDEGADEVLKKFGKDSLPWAIVQHSIGHASRALEGMWPEGADEEFKERVMAEAKKRLSNKKAVA